MVTPLGKAVEFFREFGMFEIVLPFLLVFAIVYAVLEKTKILGVTKHKNEEYTNKNLDAVVAFVVAMLVVAAANIPLVINEALPNIILLLIVLVSFLVLVGVFAKTEELNIYGWHAKLNVFFAVILFLGVVMIFLGAIRNKAGKSWLELTFNWIVEQWQGPVFASIIIFILAIVTIVWLTTGKGGSNGKNEGSSGRQQGTPPPTSG